MKIYPINNKLINTLGSVLAASSLIIAVPRIEAQNVDSFTKVETTISPQGTSDPMILSTAPNPEFLIQKEKHSAIFVVDISRNILYHYDRSGNPKAAYSIASGTLNTPTTKGIRAVTNVETYPYKSAPKTTKRYKNPQNYGPKIICLEAVDPETNKRDVTGEYIHGNNNPNSLGKYSPQGCIRMDNDVIVKLSKEVHPGDYVLIR